MKGHLSQRDLARLADVSPMTVSLALRDHPSISAETRKRIRELATQHNYRPDPALAALNAYRNKRSTSRYQGLLGWLTSFPTKTGWKKMIQASGYCIGACARAEELGYRIDEFWMNEPGMNADRATQILLSRNIRGLIVAPLPAPRGRLELDWSSFAAVALGYSLLNPSLHVVMNHQFRNMKHVVEQLHRRGYQRIGFAMPATSDDRVDHSYLGGFWTATRDLPKSADYVEPLLAISFDRTTFLGWFQRTRPDAIIVAASTAHDTIAWLREENLKVPADVGLAVASVPYRDKVISGVDEDVPSIGAHAVDTVVGMLHRNEYGPPARPFSLLIEGAWTEGRTVQNRTPTG